MRIKFKFQQKDIDLNFEVFHILFQAMYLTIPCHQHYTDIFQTKVTKPYILQHLAVNLQLSEKKWL